MGIRPVLRDDNGCALPNFGSELLTRRYAGVDTQGTDIALGTDVKHVVVHVEGGSLIAVFTGTVSGSQQVNWTSDGVTLPELALIKEADGSLVRVAAPTGTINVSVLAWR